MSKPVRLPDYLHAEIEKLAAAEKRSLANMVKVLLEQALKAEGLTERELPVAPRKAAGLAEEMSLRDAATPSRSVNPDPHFKPDPK